MWKVYNFRGEFQAEFETEREAWDWTEKHATSDMDSTYYIDEERNEKKKRGDDNPKAS